MEVSNPGSPGSRRKRDDRKTIDGPSFVRQFDSYQSGTVGEPTEQHHRMQKTSATEEINKGSGQKSKVRTFNKSMSYSEAVTSPVRQPTDSRHAAPQQHEAEASTFSHHRTSAIKSTMMESGFKSNYTPEATLPTSGVKNSRISQVSYQTSTHKIRAFDPSQDHL